MKARNSIIFALILGLACAASVTAQTVQDPSFETNTLAAGGYNTGPIPGWTLSGVGGQWKPTTTYFTSTCDGPTIAYSNGGSITQDLGVAVQANGTYTLNVCVGHRLDNSMANSTLQLLAGSTSLCSLSVNPANIPAGTFANQTLTCAVGTPPSGDLIVSLGCAGQQCDFDAVSLSFSSVNVSVAPATANVPEGQTATFTATTSDASSVNWTATSGTVSPASSASGAQVTYTAPNAPGSYTVTACSATTPSACGSATATTPHQAALSWTDTANPAGSVTYSVLRSAANLSVPFCPVALSPSYIQIASGLTVMNYTDSTIAAGTSYCYEVIATANNQSGIAGTILFVPGSVTTITVAAVYPWVYFMPTNTLTVKDIS